MAFTKSVILINPFQTEDYLLIVTMTHKSSATSVRIQNATSQHKYIVLLVQCSYSIT